LTKITKKKTYYRLNDLQDPIVLKSLKTIEHLLLFGANVLFITMASETEIFIGAERRYWDLMD